MYEIGLSGNVRRDPRFTEFLESKVARLCDSTDGLQDICVNIRNDGADRFVVRLRARLRDMDFSVSGIGENEVEAFRSATEMLKDYTRQVGLQWLRRA